MDNLVCADCGTTYYSAAAATMTRRGERCDCGGRLGLVEQDVEVPVGGPSPRNGQTSPGGPGGSARRFTRD
jgi:DNA-directed RNA polymerase subunit RPC12/RpoP